MQNTLVFEDFKNSDYPTVVKFYNSLYPEEPVGLEPLKEFDKKRQVSRVLAYENDTLIAFYTYRPDDNSKKEGLRLRIICSDELSKSNLVTIYNHLQDRITPVQGQHLITQIREAETSIQKIFERNGYLEEERMWPSTLFLKDFDSDTLKGSLENAKSVGITFKTLSDFDNNLSTQKMFYNCIRQLLIDVPTAETVNVWPFEQWKERFWDSKDRLAEANFLAFDGSALVGTSQLFPSPKEGNIKTGLTGVLKNYRGKGIAKALKLLATSYAVEKGYKTINTHNHSTNRPMLAINEAMGYIKSPAIIYLKKQL